MAIVASFTRTLPAPTATHSGGFVFYLDESWFTQATGGDAGDPLTGGSAFANGGGDLQAFTDSTFTTQLPVEVVEFVTSPASIQVRVRLPSYSSGDTITLAKDSAQTVQPLPSSTYGSQAVWQNREYHCGLSDHTSLTDSTGTASPSAVGTLTTDSTSPTGSGVSFGTSGNNYVNLNQNIGDTTGDITLRAWVKPLVSASFATLHAIRSGGTWSYQSRLESLDNAILIGSASPNSPGSPISVGTWCNLVISISSNVIAFYKDGVSQGTVNVSGTRSLNPTINATIGDILGGGVSCRSVLAEVSVELQSSTASLLADEHSNQSDPSNFGTSSGYDLTGAPPTSNYPVFLFKTNLIGF